MEDITNLYIVVFNNWHINEPIKAIQKNVWAVGEKYIIKRYSSKHELDTAINIQKAVPDNDTVSAKVLPTTKNQDFADDEEYYYLLTQRQINV